MVREAQRARERVGPQRQLFGPRPMDPDHLEDQRRQRDQQHYDPRVQQECHHQELRPEEPELHPDS